MTSGRQDDPLMEQASRLQRAHGLGRSPTVLRLFDYLLETTREGRSPKEIEVAAAVFGRSDRFDSMQDASVRVYMHRLRRKLDEYYAGAGAGEPLRLALPKGEYRLSLVANDRASAGEEPVLDPAAVPVPNSIPAWRKMIWAVAGLSLLGSVLLTSLLWFTLLRPDASRGGLMEVRRSSFWSPALTSEQPVIIVLGDYYLFGEYDAHYYIGRLIRDFNINSRSDLDNYLARHPDPSARYVDLGMRYYPLGVARALSDILPVLRASGDLSRPIRVIPVSELTPDMLRINNVVYLGYLSGLGMLRVPIFNGSRFAVGDSYDELIDRRGRQVYAATTGTGATGTQRDFGYLATFPGPSGNRIVVIAGMRDAGLTQAAKFASAAASLKKLTDHSGGSNAYEALIQVDALADQDLAGKLLLASPLDARQVWRTGTPQRFPDDDPEYFR